MNTALIKQYAMQESELSEDGIRSIMTHTQSCACAVCINFYNYLRIKERIVSWEEFKERLAREQNEGKTA